MPKPNAANGSEESGNNESVSRRVAEELHERIDQAADKGEKIERTLHERGAQAQVKARELGGGFTRIARDNPWAVVGGSLVLGVLIGALTRRR